MQQNTHPSPADLYFEAASRLDFDLAAAQFQPDGEVIDQGEEMTITGRLAIKDWLVQNHSTYALRTTVTSTEQREDCLVARVVARGTFPGSPYEFDYRFVMEGAQIESLEIRPIGELPETE